MEICYNCFKEKANAGACPHCGYDPAGEDKKYPLALKPGTLLGARYVLGRVLGHGGFGITYIALDTKTDQRVAVKEYLPAEFAGREAGSMRVQPHSADRQENFTFGREQFLEEAKTLAAFLGDDHVVRIYDSFEENGTGYFTMEYVEGLPLDAYVAEHGGRLSIEEANRLLLPLMEALERIHGRGIVHRDIAPDNIIVQPDGTAKLIDFGAARCSTGEKSKSLDMVVKHGYAPLEQYTLRGKQGAFTDVYAMAATYYFAITGTVLPDAVGRTVGEKPIPPSSMGIQISEEAEAALFKALKMMPEDRYQSMDVLRRALKDADRGASRAGARGRRTVLATLKREKGMIALAAASVCVVVAALILFPKQAAPEIAVLEPTSDEEIVTVSPEPEATPEPTEAPEEADAAETEPAEATEAEEPAAETAAEEQADTPVQISARPLFTDDRKTLAFTGTTILAAYPDGTAKSLLYHPGSDLIAGWTDIVAVDGYQNQNVFGLRSDGTVVWVEPGIGRTETLEWEGITAICAGYYHLVGLKSDGTVVGMGKKDSGQLDVSGWTDIVSVSAGESHTLGVRADGTVVAAGSNASGQLDVTGWTDIVAVSAGAGHSVGLKSDGTVVATGNNVSGQCDVQDWTDVVAVLAGEYYTIGLRSDGTVVETGKKSVFTKNDGSDWTDVVYISQGKGDAFIGYRADGTVLAAGYFDTNYARLTAESLTGIVLPEVK